MTKYYCDRCGALVKTSTSLVGIQAVNYTYTLNEERHVLGEVCIKCFELIKRMLRDDEK